MFWTDLENEDWLLPQKWSLHEKTYINHTFRSEPFCFKKFFEQN